MSVFSVSAIAVVGAVVTLLLKKNTPEVALLVSLTAVVITALMIAREVSEIFREVQAFNLQVSRKYFEIPIKSLGVTLLSTIVSELMNEAGEKALSFTVVTAGRVAVIVIAMPLVSEMLTLITRVLNGG